MTPFPRINWGHAFRLAAGLALCALGLAMIVADTAAHYVRHEAPSYVHLGLAVGLAFVGGFVIDAAQTAALADAIVARLRQVVPFLPGGRRSYDPPAADLELPPPKHGD